MASGGESVSLLLFIDNLTNSKYQSLIALFSLIKDFFNAKSPSRAKSEQIFSDHVESNSWTSEVNSVNNHFYGNLSFYEDPQSSKQVPGLQNYIFNVDQQEHHEIFLQNFGNIEESIKMLKNLIQNFVRENFSSNSFVKFIKKELRDEKSDLKDLDLIINLQMAKKQISNPKREIAPDRNNDPGTQNVSLIKKILIFLTCFHHLLCFKIILFEKTEF